MSTENRDKLQGLVETISKESKPGQIAVIGMGDDAKAIATRLAALEHLNNHEVIVVDSLSDAFNDKPELVDRANQIIDAKALSKMEIINPYANLPELKTVQFDQFDRSQVTRPIKRESPKISRNAFCSCGSGKKYKRCCMPA
jgi:preprotein translocase subunit SecA